MGAPTASLVTTGNNSWVLGVGNDYDNAVTRSVPTGQTLLHQDLTSSGDTYWAQMQASAVPAAGTTVAINDTAPTKDRYNLAIVEVLAGAGGTNAVPPTVPMTARAADATVAGQTTLAANATDRWSSGPSSNTTFVLDMTQASPAWKQTASMAYPRSFLNLTMLPDGNVLATGGETDRNGGTIANAVYSAEMWSPTTQTWSTMASMHTPREYHGTALLLPDGRVLVSGMGADSGNVPDEKSAEFYSPPYLFMGATHDYAGAGGEFCTTRPSSSARQMLAASRKWR